MRRLIKYICSVGLGIVGVYLILQSGCGEEPVALLDSTGGLFVRVRFSSTDHKIQEPRNTPSKVTVDSLSITVSASDMTTIRNVFPVVNGEVSGRIEHVPAGNDRIVTALAWHQDQPPVNLWAGSDTVTIEAGITTEASIIMDRLQEAIMAALSMTPDSTYIDSSVIADANGTIDLYAPESELEFRFFVDDVEIRSWSAESIVTFTSDAKGLRCVRVEVRNQRGDSGSAEKYLMILNRPPLIPTNLSPSGLVLSTLLPQLSWDCSDEDDDSLSYTIRYDSDSTAVHEHQPGIGTVEISSDSVIIGPINPGCEYYWNVTAEDGMTETVSPIRSFSTLSKIFLVDSAEISFPCSIAQRVVTLENLISGSMAWSVTVDNDIVSVTPAGGILGRSPVDVTISVLSRSNLEPGQISGIVSFFARGYTEQVAYDIEIDPSLSYPLPDSLELNAPSFSDTIGIGSSGCGDLSWSASITGGSWLSVEPSFGIVPASGHEVVLVKADTTALDPGMNYGTIGFDFHDGSVEVFVMAEGLENMGIIVDPDSINLGLPNFFNTTNLLNTGYGSVQWDCTWNESWLTIAPSSGNLDPGQMSEIEVVADPLQLPSGLTSAIAVFTAGSHEVSLAVNVQIPGVPILQISPRQLHVYADTDTSSFGVRNNGSGRLGWEIQSEAEWLSCEPVSGLLPAGEEDIVEILVSRIGLSLGIYETDILITSNGGNQSLPVTLDVCAPGCADPVLLETFNDGDSFGWIPLPLAGMWSVQDGRYMVTDIPPQLTAWSQYDLAVESDIWVQTDIRFTDMGGGEQEQLGGIAIRLPAGETISIENTDCTRIGAAVESTGIVHLMAMDVAGNWFFFSQESAASLFFDDWWNSIGLAVYQGGISALVNGNEEIQSNSTQTINGSAAIGLTARSTESIRFDRVYVCESP